MRRIRVLIAAAVLAGFALTAPESASQSGKRPTQAAMPTVSGSPRLEPVAETKLLMEGLAKPNFDGLAKHLKDRPADGETWSFVRGQALLVAESGNLLMMRPPKTKAAQDQWMARAADVRAAGSKVAKAANDRDYLAARAAHAELANACNRCHERFQVKSRVSPDE